MCFISEATFALPVYRWAPTPQVAEEILRWWQANRERGVASLLFCYALGKAQRVLAELKAVAGALAGEPVYLHGAVEFAHEPLPAERHRHDADGARHHRKENRLPGRTRHRAPQRRRHSVDPALRRAPRAASVPAGCACAATVGGAVTTAAS